jgi:hypothetical protein
MRLSPAINQLPPNRLSASAFALALSVSRSLAGAAVTKESINVRAARLTCATASSNAASFAADGV